MSCAALVVGAHFILCCAGERVWHGREIIQLDVHAQARAPGAHNIDLGLQRDNVITITITIPITIAVVIAVEAQEPVDEIGSRPNSHDDCSGFGFLDLEISASPSPRLDVVEPEGNRLSDFFGHCSRVGLGL